MPALPVKVVCKGQFTLGVFDLDADADEQCGWTLRFKVGDSQCFIIKIFSLHLT